jgi:hypothetical protein
VVLFLFEDDSSRAFRADPESASLSQYRPRSLTLGSFAQFW